MTDTIESNAVEVTFFEDRAQVTRTANVHVETGHFDVSLGGVSVLVDDTTVLARVVGDADVRVLTSRVRRVMRTTPIANPDEIARLEERKKAAWAAYERARREYERLEIESDRAENLEEELTTSMRRAPAKAAPDEWARSLEKTGALIEEVVEKRAAKRAELVEFKRAYDRAGRLLNEGRIQKPEVVATIELQLDVPSARDVELELVYYVPCAVWRPSHVARLSPDRSSIELRMLGTVWQRTGEVWKDVHCRFSTARPTQAAEAPILSDDWLVSRPKTDLERNVVEVAARDVDIASTGSETHGAVEQMPGVDDGGEPLAFEATERVTIPSTGEPFRVEYARRNVPCRVGVVALPERATVPFLRAQGTWDHDVPILAGPVVILRGNQYAGRSRIDFVARGDTFELGFGAEGAVSVHRTVDDEHTTTRVTGKNILNREVRISLSNLSDERRHLNVVERVPVSEIEEVSVQKVVAEAQPDKDGFIEFAVDLKPREVKTLTVTYRVEYGSKVRLSW